MTLPKDGMVSREHYHVGYRFFIYFPRGYEMKGSYDFIFKGSVLAHFWELPCIMMMASFQNVLMLR